jgi:hypothetical protein
MSNASQPSAPFVSQITETYHYMRIGMGVLAVAFPLLLWLGGKWLMGIPMQTSLSAYYHADIRDLFVGVLSAIGFTLFLYKGFSRSEDWALNAAGVLAIGIAFFPMAPDNPLRCRQVCIDAACLATSARFDRTFDPLIASGLHGWFAVAFFVAIAFVCICCASRTLHLIPDRRVRRAYHWTYRLLGALMILLPAAVALLTKLDPASANDCTDFTVVRVEIAGVWVFAAYWLVKTREASKYGADRTYPNRRAIPEQLARAI